MRPPASARSVLVLLAALWIPMSPAGPAASARAPDRWLPPVRPTVVIRAFDPPAQPWLAGHRGIDLRTEPGRPVRAAGTGRVAFAGQLAGRGVVVVDHGTLRTTYEPVEAEVVVGEWVLAGEPLGHVGVGSGHCGAGNCLHLGLRRGPTYLDPRLLLTHGQARLRPW